MLASSAEEEAARDIARARHICTAEQLAGVARGRQQRRDRKKRMNRSGSPLTCEAVAADDAGFLLALGLDVALPDSVSYTVGSELIDLNSFSLHSTARGRGRSGGYTGKKSPKQRSLSFCCPDGPRSSYLSLPSNLAP